GHMPPQSHEPFSRRHGFRPAEPPITVWEDAPEDFRHTVLATAHEKCGMKPYALRDLVCGVLRKRPDPSNWSEYPNVWGEVESLAAAGKETAHNELQEALKDISRRPEPDATGAVQHSMAALECVAKDVTGEHKATLGQILARHATVVPKPLDVAVDKLWGFAS